MSHPIYRVRIFCSSLHSLPKVHFCPKIQFDGNTENTKKVLSHFARLTFYWMESLTQKKIRQN